jgi:hypothetical protein
MRKAARGIKPQRPLPPKCKQPVRWHKSHPSFYIAGMMAHWSICSIFVLLLSGGCASRQWLKSVHSASSGKPVTAATYSARDPLGFCYLRVMLNDDSTFLLSSGCEGTQQIGFGRWKSVGDSIVLMSLPRRRLKMSNLICDVKLRGNRSDKNGRIYFVITDKTGEAFGHLTFLPIPADKTQFKTRGKAFRYRLKHSTDADGELLYEVGNSRGIKFEQLEQLTGKRYRIPIRELADSVAITLTINSVDLSFGRTPYYGLSEKWLLRYYLKGDTLYNGPWRLVRNKP